MAAILDVWLEDLWIVEDFINSFLDAINGSLMEFGLAEPPPTGSLWRLLKREQPDGG
jgi:hypothetical protein